MQKDPLGEFPLLGSEPFQEPLVGDIGFLLFFGSVCVYIYVHVCVCARVCMCVGCASETIIFTFTNSSYSSV